MNQEKDMTDKKPRGRPPKKIPKIDASPEQIARAMFSAVKPPDPSVRIVKQNPKPKKKRQ